MKTMRNDKPEMTYDYDGDDYDDYFRYPSYSVQSIKRSVIGHPMKGGWNERLS